MHARRSLRRAGYARRAPHERGLHRRQPARPPQRPGDARRAVRARQAPRARAARPPPRPRRRRRDLDRLRLAPRPPPAARAAVAAGRLGHRRRPHARSPSSRAAPTRASSARPARSTRSRTARSTSSCTGSSCTTSPTPARSSRACARRTGCCGPAARSWRSSPTSFTPSAPGSRSPTAPGSASRCTARPTTSRCRRGASRPPRARPACGPQLHAVSYSWRRLPRRVAARRRGARSLRLGARPALGRAHVHAHRPPLTSGCTSRRASRSGPATSRSSAGPRATTSAARSSRTRSSSRCAAAGSATSPGWRT